MKEQGYTLEQILRKIDGLLISRDLKAKLKDFIRAHWDDEGEGVFRMMQAQDSEGGVVDILIGVGLLAVATYLYLNDPRGGDDEDDWPPGNGGGPGNGP